VKNNSVKAGLVKSCS